MNALAKTETTALAAMTEGELLTVLGASLYPGAAPESIKMVLGYCKAAGLDPMQKPVHIVPMWDGKAKQMRDVIMPGVGSYRVQAARNGCAGVSEPEFGPDVTADLGGIEITFPAWCRVTAKRRLATGELVEFTAKELWKENYATAGKDNPAPNAMWKKRPYGQLAKCAEAQALRKAFPEIGSEPTADEMAGKVLNDDDVTTVIDAGTGEIVGGRRAAPAPYPTEQFNANLPKWREVIAAGRKTPDQIIAMAQTKHPLTEEQIATVRGLPAEILKDAAKTAAAAPVMTYAQVADKLNRAGDLDKLAEAGSLIAAVADETQRTELGVIYDRRAAELAV